MRREIIRKMDICLSKVILLRDAFSGEALTNGMRIQSLQGGKTILKPGGYCLFLDMDAEEFEIEIESPVYQSRRILLKADHGEEAEEVFLYPCAAYPLKNHTTIVLGNAKPGSLFRFHLEEETGERRLLCDYQEGEEQISIFTRERAGARTRMWFVRDKEKKIGEYFQVQKPLTESELCRLVQPLKRGYRKKDASLYQAYECMTDENGEFYLPLDGLREQKYKLYYSNAENGEDMLMEADIQGTKQNIISERYKGE